MSKADEMFKKLEYKKEYKLNIYDQIEGILYINSRQMISISFDYEEHLVCAYITADDKQEQPAYITMQELQAINEKCKELGWG